MVLELDKNLVKQMAPFIKMSLVAINIASLVTVGISVLPSDLGLSFLDLKLEDVISSFDDEYRNVMKDAEFADPKALEKTFKSLESTDEDIVKKTIELTGKSYRAFSEKALKQKNRECWEPFMKIGVLECGPLGLPSEKRTEKRRGLRAIETARKLGLNFVVLSFHLEIVLVWILVSSR
jgi:hypothetical protein